MPFSFSLNSSTIKPTPILKKIMVAAQAGYEGIELWHDDIDTHCAEGGTVDEIRNCIADHGLKVPTTIHLKDWFQPAGEDHSAAMDIAKRKLEQAAIVGADYTIAGPPHGPADRALGQRHYHELLELGAAFGVRPAFEYLGFVEDIKTIDDAFEIVSGASHPNACLVLDPFHCHVGGGGIESISKLAPGQIAISHFNDAPAEPAASVQRDPDRVMPGDGVIDLKRYCNLLRQIGFEGFVSLELFRADLWEMDPLEVAQMGLEKMRAAAEG